MTRSLCTFCGLRSSHCQCHQQASTAPYANGDDGERAFKLTPASFCVFYLLFALAMIGVYLFLYLIAIIPVIHRTCYLEVTDVKSLSTQSNRVSSAEISFYPSHPFLILLVTGKINDVPVPYAVFKTVATPRNELVWDLRLEVVTSVKIKGRAGHGDGFLIVTCRDIPVNFTADPAGNVNGSLIGYMRPCEYLVQKEYTDTSF
ncbi:unnamed protein product [Arabidopsis lyrata]|nr:unnamed protein product [Arabidopsis lyrata]